MRYGACVVPWKLRADMGLSVLMINIDCIYVNLE